MLFPGSSAAITILLLVAAISLILSPIVDAAAVSLCLFGVHLLVRIVHIT